METTPIDIAARHTPPTPSTTRPTWLHDTVWPWTPQQLTTAHGPISYTDTGGQGGPAVLLVHVGMWSFVWRDLMRGLTSTGYRCVSLDAPGTGLSATGTARPAIGVAADAIDTLVRVLDLRDFVLVTHDLGTTSALDAASRWPERLRGLVVVNGFGWRPSGIVFRGMLAFMGNSIVREFSAVTGWLAWASATRFGAGRRWNRDDRRAFRAGLHRRQRRAFHHYMASARRHDYRAVDRALDAFTDLPSATIFGQRNDPLHFQPKWKTRLPNVEQTVIPGGYHFPMCDDPDHVTATITAIAKNP